MSFLEEESFDRKQYDIYLGKIQYDDRDAIMYMNMLDFLWEYVIHPGIIEDQEGLLLEYEKWNMRVIEKVYYHKPHDIPYANIRRVYQSIVSLLKGDIDKGLEHLENIGTISFSYDGKAPKVFMDSKANVYRPMSKLFVIYNYAKVLEGEKLDAFMRRYSYAFTCFNDGKNDEHDEFLRSQMEDHKGKIFYPVFSRVYKKPGMPADFFLYFNENSTLKL